VGGWTVSHGTCLPAGAIAEYAPFDLVTLTRERDDAGEPTQWYGILGERQGGERSRRIQAEILFVQADTLLQTWHGTTEQAAPAALWHHAILRAAVAFLMD